MLAFLLFLLGAAITAFTVFDFLKTAIGMAGLGPMTKRISSRLWQLARRAIPWARQYTNRRLEDAAGPLILAVMAICWITLNSLGYTLMFSASYALVDIESKLPADTIERVAFAGSALSTLGASLVQPGNGWWDMLSMLAAVNGMVVLTLSVSFVMSVLQATAEGRALALRITSLEAHENEIAPTALAAELASLAHPLAIVAMKIRAMPMIGYFTSPRDTINLPEALLLACDMVERADTPPRPEGQLPGIAALRMALREFGEFDSASLPGTQMPGLEPARAWAREHILHTDRN